MSAPQWPVNVDVRTNGPDIALNKPKVWVDGHGPMQLTDWIVSVEARLKALGTPMTEEMAAKLTKARKSHAS